MKSLVDLAQGITVDSREVKPGFIFVAIKGTLVDGHNYIDKAVASGAKIIVHQDIVNQLPGVTYLKVDDSRAALSQLAALFYPQQSKYILGVTGTSGKSSVVHFIREILHILGKKAVSIGTLGVIGDVNIASNLTTPATIELHKILQEIAKNNVEYAAIECSSHGIEQHRLDSVHFTACAFTNFSQDHLDYHHSMEAYLQAKMDLFKIMDQGYVVLNSDIAEYQLLLEHCQKYNHNIITYAKLAQDVKIKSIKTSGLKQQVEWEIYGQQYFSDFNLVGEFQIYNLACALGLLMAADIDIKQILPLIAQIKTVPGRMELVANYNEAGIFVDYSHKPEALSHSLQTIKKITKNKLTVVFGCGGERDQIKRPIMGEIASKYADEVIITDDNPRGENPVKIREAIIAGAVAPVIEIGDREEAIKYAISQLASGDNLLIAGKGHENYQLVGDKAIDFSDTEKVLSIVRNMS